MISASAHGFLAAALMMAVPTMAMAAIPVTVRGGDATEVQEQADGSAVHRGSGLRFPKQVGSMQIGKLVVYQNNDASAVYYASNNSSDPWLSFYIYPVAQSLDAEEETVTASIEQAWTAKRIAAPIGLALPADARSGWYDVRNDKVSGKSVYAIAFRGDWFLKARVTIPHDAGDAALAQVQAALSALPWAAAGAQPAIKPPQPVGRATAN